MADIVATGMVMQTFLLIFAILSGALMSMVIAAPLYYMLGPETNAAWKTAGIVIAIGTFFYAPIAWLACVLWEDWRAANPMIVLGAIFRLNSRLVKFYVEVFVHFVVIVVLASVALPAFAASAILGGIVWIAFWTFTLLSGARLSRALGIVYAEHFRLLGWFT